jgi:uncharacterized protein (DUF2147 family)
MRKLIPATLIAAVLAVPAAWAQNSPVGLWKTIDDETGKPKSLVRISETPNGELTGKVEKLFRDPSEDQNPKCIKCEGAMKDQPILGMTILTGLKKDGESYTGGHVIDPGKGKSYNAKVTVKDDGKKLDMRGYIGTPLLGRTQTWVREQ